MVATQPTKTKVTKMTNNLGATFGQGEFKDEYQPLPVGQYKLAVTNTELAESGQNSKNPGTKYLKVEIEVQDGEYQGRKIFNRLNLFHPDDKVKKIAQVELEKIATAIGKVIQNHEDLRGVPFLADVIVQTGRLKNPSNDPETRKKQEEDPNAERYADSNVIKKYYPITAGAMPKATTPANSGSNNGSVWG